MVHRIMLDTHCHIGEYHDPLAEVRALDGSAVVAVAVTSSPRDFEELHRRFGGERRIRVALGAHPLRAARLGESEWHIFERCIAETSYVGEVGLVFSPEGERTRAARAQNHS